MNPDTFYVTLSLFEALASHQIEPEVGNGQLECVTHFGTIAHLWGEFVDAYVDFDAGTYDGVYPYEMHENFATALIEEWERHTCLTALPGAYELARFFLDGGIFLRKEIAVRLRLPIKQREIRDYEPEVRDLLGRFQIAGFGLLMAGEPATLDQLTAEILAVDECRVTVCLDSERFTMFIVLGNSPGELVCDYGIREGAYGYKAFEAIIDDHANAWEGTPQRVRKVDVL